MVRSMQTLMAQTGVRLPCPSLEIQQALQVHHSTYASMTEDGSSECLGLESVYSPITEMGSSGWRGLERRTRLDSLLQVRVLGHLMHLTSFHLTPWSRQLWWWILPPSFLTFYRLCQGVGERYRAALPRPVQCPVKRPLEAPLSTPPPSFIGHTLTPSKTWDHWIPQDQSALQQLLTRHLRKYVRMRISTGLPSSVIHYLTQKDACAIIAKYVATRPIEPCWYGCLGLTTSSPMP
jgi:hypothetical protein